VHPVGFTIGTNGMNSIHQNDSIIYQSVCSVIKLLRDWGLKLVNETVKVRERGHWEG
jgi:hypothetical protein